MAAVTPGGEPERPTLAESRTRSSSNDSTLSDCATVVPDAASPVDLTLLHACTHCRASKTACTDCRPCVRCVRLGLNCAAYLDKPRKRACVSCHTNKVACDLHLSGDDPCSRCKRLNNPCVPREQVRQRGVRKRRRKGEEDDDAVADALVRAAGDHSSLLLQACKASEADDESGYDAAAQLLLGLSSGGLPSPPSATGASPPSAGASPLDLLGLSLDEQQQHQQRTPQQPAVAKEELEPPSAA